MLTKNLEAAYRGRECNRKPIALAAPQAVQLRLEGSEGMPRLKTVIMECVDEAENQSTMSLAV